MRYEISAAAITHRMSFGYLFWPSRSCGLHTRVFVWGAKYFQTIPLKLCLKNSSGKPSNALGDKREHQYLEHLKYKESQRRTKCLKH